MTFNYRQRDILRRGIADYVGERFMQRDQQLDDVGNFTKFLVVDLKKEEFEIPCFCRDFIGKAIHKNLNYPLLYNYEKAVIPLFLNNVSLTKRTGDAIINCLFTNGSLNLNVLKDSRDNKYYGTKGLILSSDYTPLLLTTITCKTKDNDKKDIFYLRTNVRVNPIVLDSDNVVEKSIVKKLLNFYSSTDIDIFRGDAVDLRDKKTARIIIDNFDEFFVSPVTPKAGDCNNDILNDILVNNIRDFNLH